MKARRSRTDELRRPSARSVTWRGGILVIGAVAIVAGFAFQRARAGPSLGQVWPPFALVTGLLFVGFLAHQDGLFEWAGAHIARMRSGERVLFIASMLLVAAVTAIFNLDTAVVFLTPMLVHVARSRGVDEAPFLYGTVMTSNAASLLLPGSNLTNLLVLHGSSSGSAFAARMAPAWVASVLTTVVILVAWHHRSIGARKEPPFEVPSLTVREGVVATVVVSALILSVRAPALPVLGVGISALIARWARQPLDVRSAIRYLDLTVIAGVFGIALGFGTLARAWDTPARMLRTTGTWASAGIGAVGAVLVNNLPATMLLSANSPAHPRALLIGLNLGPNLAVTGSLSAVLWFRAARGVGANASARVYSRIGLLIAPCAAVAALLAVQIFKASLH